jgi:hypothetical protein
MLLGEAGGVCEPPSVAEALRLLDRALDFLNAADVAGLPATTQAEALRALEAAQARQTAAQARLLGAFMAQDGFAADGQGSARAWLRWQTRITGAAAATAVGWVKRLAGHPVIARALARGELSASWARQICDWTGRLPRQHWAEADAILVKAAAAGADLPDLARLAGEMHARLAGPDTGDPDFEDRWLRLGTTLDGAGRLEGDLAPGCAAALAAVLEALGKKAGPEDTRAKCQRDHDALFEACRRLIAAGMVPERAGQPTRLHVHMTLSQLRGEPGAPEAQAAWAARRAGQDGWLTGAEADAAACDATVVPVVTGYLDPAALGQLTQAFLAARGRQPASAPGSLAPAAHERLASALLSLAADTLSGPAGLAAALRARAGGPLSSVSLPLDIGAASEIIPAHLRRAVLTRHPRCAFPGCATPGTCCDIHHIVTRSRGGPTALWNLVPLCVFHHLVAIHRWGWSLALNPDGTTTAASPDRSRTLHSHGPPGRAA